jgi:tyrosyl-tRNA synthetase
MKIGGATALIGDPSGRSTERPLLDRIELQRNIDKLRASVARFFSRAARYAQTKFTNEQPLPEADILNNIEWFEGLGLLQFLRSAGIYARVNSMIARERRVQVLSIVLHNLTSLTSVFRPG